MADELDRQEVELLSDVHIFTRSNLITQRVVYIALDRNLFLESTNLESDFDTDPAGRQ